MMALKQIISGGQTGADIAGLKAGRELGLVTGGMAPKGYINENGNQWWLRDYGLCESNSSKYDTRTRFNVKDSDGTVIFTLVPLSGGSRLTYNTCEELYKPKLVINPSGAMIKDDLIAWLIANNIVILNVSGNRESKCRGIELKVKTFLVEALKGVI